MDRMMLDDFIKYAKEKFDCEITVKKSDNPDTFAGIFGAGFLDDNNCVEVVCDFESNINYENITIDVQFDQDGVDGIYNSNVGLAA